MADPVLEALRGGGASSATLDAAAKTLTLPGAGGQPNDIAAKHTLTTASGKELSPSLGAIYLCLAKPDQSYVAYRKECKELGVEACRVTDRKDVLEYFGVAEGEAAGDSAAAAPAPAAAAAAADASSSDKKKDDADDRKRSGRDKDRKRSSGGGRDKRKESHEERKARKLREKEEAERRQKEKDEAAARLRAQKKERAKTGMTNEELMEGLDVVVDKRDEEELGGGGGGGKTTGLDGEDGAAASASASGGGAAPTPTVLSEEEKEEEEERKQHALIIQSLSSTGFEVGGMADAIESDRKAVEAITAMEIPVGNSASVLRCGAGVGDSRRDFSRVLELYTESLKAEERAKRAAAGGDSRGGSSGSGGPPGSSSDRKRSSSGGDRWGPKDPKRAKGGDPGSSSKSGRNTPPRPKATGPPIIVVPNAMTSPITLVNATDFFGNATFVPRDVALKKAGGNASLAQLRKETVMVRHKVAPRLGGREIDFEIVDNPTTRLRNPADWDRVVAVIAQGAEWQFKNWRHSKPVDLFGRCFGFYVGIEGAPVPKELLGWNVKLGKLNRDKRGLDSVTFASFWNGLSEWMHVNKPEYLKLEQEGA